MSGKLPTRKIATWEIFGAAAVAAALAVITFQRDITLGDKTVWLLMVYVGLMVVGDIADYLIGLVVERMWGQEASLIVFLILYFVFLWIAWLIAVRVTEPPAEVSPAPR